MLQEYFESYIHVKVFFFFFATHIVFISITVKKIQSVLGFSRGHVTLSSLLYIGKGLGL